MTTATSPFFVPIPKQVILRQKAMRDRKKILMGLEGQEAWFFTLTKGRDECLSLRTDAWHKLRTRFAQKWELFAACTMCEYNEVRGNHLHVIVKDTPGLTESWVLHMVELLGDGTKVGGFEAVYDDVQLTRYVAKQLADESVRNFWPRHFRPTSFTWNWAPRWLPLAEYKKQQKALKGNRRRPA